MDLLIYLIEANIAIFLIWAYYRIGLKGGRDHRFNRKYWIFGLLLALVAPLLALHLPIVHQLQEPISFQLNAVISPAQNLFSNPSNTGFSISPGGIYWLVVMVMTGFLVLRYGKLIALIVRKARRNQDGILMVTESEYGPASWGPILFWNEKTDQEPGRDAIYAHELAHIHQGHTYDLILHDIVRIICWFNPFVYLIRNEIRNIHEFLADEAALDSSRITRLDMQKLILARQFGLAELPAAHSFHSNTQNRLIMLKTTISSKRNLAKLLAAPFLILLFATVTFSGLTAQQNAEKGYQMQDTDTPPRPLNMVEVMQKSGYPESAREQGLEEKIFVKALVNEDGKIDSWEYAKPLQHDVFDATIRAAIEDFRFSPGLKDGKSVKVYVTIPFLYELGDEE